MPRSARTLLIVVVLGLVGVLALTWMARRYANLAPASPATPAREEVPAASPAPVPAPAPEAAAPAPPESSATAEPSEADLLEVDRFVAVRRALQQVIAAKPAAAKQLAEQLGGGDAAQIKPLQFNLVFLMKYRLTREEAILKEGWTLDGYRGVRRDYDAWREGKAPADPARAAAFEARRAALEGAGLEGLEALDRAADTGVDG